MFREMDRYSLISTPLPFEIQNKIIVIAEFIWYNDKVNMIINNWYRYLSRKITMYRISTTLKKYYIETEGSLIDPMCEINKKKIKYIYKYFTGNTEDIFYWKKLLIKICRGIIDKRDKFTVLNNDYREINDLTYIFIIKIMKKEIMIVNDVVVSKWLNKYILDNEIY